MMIKKRDLILAGIVLIAFLAFVMAAAGDGIKIMAPASGTNFTNLTAVVLNVSYANLSDITSPGNATFWLNISGTWTKIANTTSCTLNTCFVTVTNITIPDGVYSLNATIYNGSTTISIANVSNMSHILYFDATRPIIFSNNISNPVTGGNYSGTIILNTSAVDATIGIGTLMFNITNNSAFQNASVTASAEVFNSQYSVSINTSHYPDGYYNITIFANDSVGNINDSARIYSLIFDNTPPAITHSCDDYSVEEEDTITCTCSASDALSGVNLSYGASGVSFTANPSTTSTGNSKQTTCTAQDKANNLNTSTLYYNVTGGSSTGGSSSGGSSSGGSTSGTSTGSTTTSNATDENATDAGNLLQGNQGNDATPDILSDVNYWLIGGVVLAVALIGALIYLMKKKGIGPFKN